MYFIIKELFLKTIKIMIILKIKKKNIKNMYIYIFKIN